MDTERHVEVLECTLRDGSYAIDYQFTAEDTAVLALGLERAGFRMIEIGHGLGLGASETAGRAAATDLEYVEAARNALTEAKFGTFLIPGIGSLDSLRRAAENGMGFVRIGTNVTDVDSAREYIEVARELGLYVSSNLMKSYAVSTSALLEQARKACAWGAHVVSVVDSAGGMLPDEVREAVSALSAHLGCRVGFHGHNNLDLALANTIAAVEEGATVVDSSLQGMGRSAGNAQTELLVVALGRLGWHTGIDPFAAFDLGDRLIAPMTAYRRGVDSLSAVMGLAQFHSGFEATVRRAADLHGVDIRRLIVAVSEVDRVNVTEQLAERMAAQLAQATPHSRQPSRVGRSICYMPDVFETDSICERAGAVADQMRTLSRKTGKPTVFTLAGSDAGHTRFPYVRQSTGYIVGNAEVATLEDAHTIIGRIDGAVDWILIDTSRRDFANLGSLIEGAAHESRVLPYDDLGALVASIDAQLRAACSLDCGVLIAGSGEFADRLRAVLGARVAGDASSTATSECVAAIVVAGNDGSDTAERSCSNLMVLDCRLAPDRPLRATGALEVIRVDMRAGLNGAVAVTLETDHLVRVARGSAVIEGVHVVAGGILGERGAVVVDSVTEPSVVIGVADGSGALLREAESAHCHGDVRTIREYIARTRFLD